METLDGCYLQSHNFESNSTMSNRIMLLPHLKDKKKKKATVTGHALTIIVIANTTKEL